MRTRAYVAFSDDEETDRRPEKSRSHRAKAQTRIRRAERALKLAERAV